MHYLFVENEKIIGAGQCRSLSCSSIEVTKEDYDKYIEAQNYFIVQNGCIIPNPNFEKEEEVKAKKAENEALKKELDELDLKAVRPLRAIISGEATDADRMRLVELENEAQSVRAKITENNSIINNGGVNE